MNPEVTLDDVCILIGRLTLENHRLLKQIPVLEEQIKKMTEEVTKLRSEMHPNVIITQPAERISEAA